MPRDTTLPFQDRTPIRRFLPISLPDSTTTAAPRMFLSSTVIKGLGRLSTDHQWHLSLGHQCSKQVLYLKCRRLRCKTQLLYHLLVAFLLELAPRCFPTGSTARAPWVTRLGHQQATWLMGRGQGQLSHRPRYQEIQILQEVISMLLLREVPRFRTAIWSQVTVSSWYFSFNWLPVPTFLYRFLKKKVRRIHSAAAFCSWVPDCQNRWSEKTRITKFGVTSLD